LRQVPAIPAETKLSGSLTVIEVIIGDAVIRAGTEIDEAHLQRVICGFRREACRQSDQRPATVPI